jgi:hypothetical protein|tara:strand:- start:249 stop:422 length:174 start_codon:yes stop_codon:yes gene_type:complete
VDTVEGGGGEGEDADDIDDVAKQRAFRVVVIIIFKGFRRSIFVWKFSSNWIFQFTSL